MPCGPTESQEPKGHPARTGQLQASNPRCQGSRKSQTCSFLLRGLGRVAQPLCAMAPSLVKCELQGWVRTESLPPVFRVASPWSSGNHLHHHSCHPSSGTLGPTRQECLLRPCLCPPDPCSLTRQGLPGGVSPLLHFVLSWFGLLGIQRCVSATDTQPCSGGTGGAQGHTAAGRGAGPVPSLLGPQPPPQTPSPGGAG